MGHREKRKARYEKHQENEVIRAMRQQLILMQDKLVLSFENDELRRENDKLKADNDRLRSELFEAKGGLGALLKGDNK